MYLQIHGALSSRKGLAKTDFEKHVVNTSQHSKTYYSTIAGV